MNDMNLAKHLVVSFLKEACRFLQMDADTISVRYSQKSSPMGVYVWGVADEMVVEEQFLSSCVSRNSFTPLRMKVYVMVRFIQQQRRHGKAYSLQAEQPMDDAMGFANALMFLKGIRCPCPPSLSASAYFAPSLTILKDVFGLTGNVFVVPDTSFNNVNHYQIHLDSNSEKHLLAKYMLRNDQGKPRIIKLGEKGSIENPFDNIKEAMEWLRNAEAEAYAQDGLMQDIANEQYFYDLDRGYFRIDWAASYVAHRNNRFPDHTFVVSQMTPLNPHSNEPPFFTFKPNLYRHKFLYRGQSDYYAGKPCVPNLFRDKAHNDKGYYLDFLIFSQEMELLIKSLPLVQLLEKGIELLHDTFKIRMHYTGLAQHYYNKSIFLDLTSDLDVAAFFATTSCKDGIFQPLSHCEKTGVIYYYNLEFPNAFQQHKGYALKNIGKQLFLRSGAQRGFLLEMQKGVDFKTLPEVNAVYFKHDDTVAEEIFRRSDEGKNYFGEDLLQHAWHDRLKGRFEQRIVSRKAVERNVELNPKETEESITKKLNGMGISVDDYVPSFTDEELSTFYENIDEWWSDFCNDIYFASSDGEWYREELKAICRRPEYQWAFRQERKKGLAS